MTLETLEHVPCVIAAATVTNRYGVVNVVVTDPPTEWGFDPLWRMFRITDALTGYLVEWPWLAYGDDAAQDWFELTGFDPDAQEEVA